MDRSYKREFIDEDIECISELTKIGVFSFTKTSGTSFVATSLAKYLAGNKKKSVAYIDLQHDSANAPLLYDGLGMAYRFASREFTSFYSEIKDKKYIKRLKNIESGINWAIRTPKDRELGVSLTPLEEARLLNNICGDFVICDFGSVFCKQTMEEMDIIICVIDPMPSSLLASKVQIQRLKIEDLDGRHLFWVVNKYNHGVNSKLLKRFLRIKNLVTIPLIPQEWFYVAQYRCRVPFEQDEINKEALSAIEQIVNHHILFT